MSHTHSHAGTYAYRNREKSCMYLSIAEALMERALINGCLCHEIDAVG